MGRKKILPPASHRVEPLATNIEKMMAEFDPPISKRALSLRAGLSESFVRDILDGRSLNPQYSSIEKLAKAGGKTAEWLTSETPDAKAALAAETADLDEAEIKATLAFIRHQKALREPGAA